MVVSQAIPVNSVARGVGFETKFRDRRGESGPNFLPQDLFIIGQGTTAQNPNYTTDPVLISSASEAGQMFGFGSPIHLVALRLYPTNGDGAGIIPTTVYPLKDDASGVAATGSVTPSGSQTTRGLYQVRVNNISSVSFLIEDGDILSTVTAAITQAINGTQNLPITATDNGTDVGITSKWQGASGNAIFLEIIGPSDGYQFAVVQPSGGAINPDVDIALNQFGSTWHTMGINCLDIDDNVSLDKIQAFGELRWQPLENTFFVCFTGNPGATVMDLISVPDARKTDRVNAQIPGQGTKDLPFMVAASSVARIAVIANRNPPLGYAFQSLNGLPFDENFVDFNFIDRDALVKGGSSSLEVRNGQVVLSDVVTFYHPDDEPVPAYRYVSAIIRIQNIVNDLKLTFDTPEWIGKPLIPSDQVSVNPDSVSVDAYKAALSTRIDFWGLQAWISDPQSAKDSIVANISPTNPNRIDSSHDIQLSGNLTQLAVDNVFGYFFGSNEIL